DVFAHGQMLTRRLDLYLGTARPLLDDLFAYSPNLLHVGCKALEHLLHEDLIALSFELKVSPYNLYSVRYRTRHMALPLLKSAEASNFVRQQISNLIRKDGWQF